MGEANARMLRGAEMEDVTFAGTATRPGLHHAEVALTLDGGSFPAPFAGLSVVQVTRHIERGTGSAYQVNGRKARARNGQALFADHAGGARSFATVGQGQVGALVQARPENRRGLLDEATGIAGLHARLRRVGGIRGPSGWRDVLLRLAGA
jgi:chromosome segregation protein